MTTPITGLNDLFARMIDYDSSVMSGDDWSDSLPNFGGEHPDGDPIEAIWSWDNERLIVGENSDDLRIVKRTDWEAV